MNACCECCAVDHAEWQSNVQALVHRVGVPAWENSNIGRTARVIVGSDHTQKCSVKPCTRAPSNRTLFECLLEDLLE